MPEVFIMATGLPPVNEAEVLRYAQCGPHVDERTLALMRECIDSLEFTFGPRACYCILEKEEFLAACPLARESERLQFLLKDSDRIVVFAATVGLAFDYSLERCLRKSLAEAQMLQAIGTERIEALCDWVWNKFVNQAEINGDYVTRRFSPGYGDFPLEAQRDFFRILSPRRIGMGLTDGLTMVPSKSVTAVFGLSRIKPKECKTGCEVCMNKETCAYKK